VEESKSISTFTPDEDEEPELLDEEELPLEPEDEEPPTFTVVEESRSMSMSTPEPEQLLPVQPPEPVHQSAS
jgi:hypothetical protein